MAEDFEVRDHADPPAVIASGYISTQDGLISVNVDSVLTALEAIEVGTKLIELGLEAVKKEARRG